MAALDLLRLNNAQAYKHILDKGGMQMLEGLKQYGVGLGRNQARCGWPARPQPADWPRLAGARGSLEHDLALQEASAEPAGRRLTTPVPEPTGFGEMRGLVSETIDSLQRPPTATGVASVDASGHVKQAHQQRMKHSKLWDSMGLKRAYAPQ